MKKLVLIMLTVFLNLGLISCTEESLNDKTDIVELTGGEEGQTPEGENDD